MSETSLQAFADRVIERGLVTREDVRELSRNLAPDGLMSCRDVDLLLAIDRAVQAADEAWADYLVASVVEFAVWTLTPTGYVGQDTAQWLVTTLSCGDQPTANATRVGFEIVKEAQQVDEILLAFVLKAGPRRTMRVEPEAPSLAA